MLWNAADQQAPSDEAAGIPLFGMDILDGVPVPVLAHDDLADTTTTE